MRRVSASQTNENEHLKKKNKLNIKIIQYGSSNGSSKSCYVQCIEYRLCSQIYLERQDAGQFKNLASPGREHFCHS